MKLTVAVLLVLAYVGINLIAKKTILISLISIAVSALLAASQKVRQQQDVFITYMKDREVDWDGGDLGVRNGHADYGRHSSSTAHTLA